MRLSKSPLNAFFIIDFDSTFTQVEGLDELASISLRDDPFKDDAIAQISDLTRLSMEGKMSFHESLTQRVALLKATRKDLERLVEMLKKRVSTSFSRNKNFFKSHQGQVYIISGGFKEFIIPVVKPYHIASPYVFANTFLFNKDDRIIGFDKKNPLSEEGGKVKLLKQLRLKGTLYGIGDGHSDYQLKASGLIKTFFAFTENIAREKVIAYADHITPSFDEFLFINKLPMSISYPKNRILCLAVGQVPDTAIALLRNDGLSIRVKATLEPKYFKDVGLLLMGKEQTLDAEVLALCTRLKVIGYLGNRREGMNAIPYDLASQSGIAIFNQPEGSQGGRALAKQMIDCLNIGSTYRSANFPALRLPPNRGTHRFIHIHKNVPGVMAEINTTLARHSMNIAFQYLGTNASIGYVITDVNISYGVQVLQDLKKIDHTIKFRVLY